MYRILDYRDCPEHGPTIAERVWRAWWRPAGHPLSDVHDHLPPMLDPASLPLALVCVNAAGDYAGSAFLIVNDLAERPRYAPWLAALWVEEAERRRGIATALLSEGVRRAFGLGHAVIYLCCARDLEGFYGARNWALRERGVGGHALSVLARRRDGVPAGA